MLPVASASNKPPTLNPTLSEALALREAGISCIPTTRNKQPALPEWKPFQSRLPTEAELHRWFPSSEVAGLARVHGPVSGNLETLDFDCGDEIVSEWAQIMGDLAPGLVERLTRLRTPRPGTQFCYRCETPVSGNQKLAEVPKPGGKPGEWETLIETRGEGGYAVCPPTPASFHPMHRPYEHHSGPPLANVPTITEAEREMLLSTARMFTQKPAPSEFPKLPPATRENRTSHDRTRNATSHDVTPWDDFNEKTTWRDVLQSRGWELVETRGEMDFWKRPGGHSRWSATTNFKGNDLLHVFSTSAGLEAERSYSRAAAVAYLDHRGDFVEAAKAMRAAGYGTPTGGSTGKHSLPAPISWQPFPVDALPDTCQRFVTGAATSIGCDPSFVALPLLAGLAAAIGNSRSVRLKHGWEEPPVIWAIIVGDSGTMKSPAVDAPLKPIRQRQFEAIKDFNNQLADYDLELQRHEAVKAEWKKKKDTTEPPPTEPFKPICDRFWCSDVTVEALADRLKDNPRGLLLVRDELSGWLGSFNQYKGGRGGDAAHWLTLHGARDLIIDRKTGDKTTICVRRAAVSITGGIQPEILRDALGRQHFQDGLAARMLLAYPPRTPKRWTEADISPALEVELAELFGKLWDLRVGIDASDDPCPVVLTLTPEAKAVWVEWYDRHSEELSDLAGDLAAAWSKLQCYVPRLALVLHCVFAVNGEGDSETVDQRSMEAAIKLVEWFKNETKRVYSVLSETDVQRERRRLVELIARKGGRITPRELQAGDRRFRGSVEPAEEALDDLVESGLGHWEDQPAGTRGGRPCRVFCLSQSVSGQHNPENSAEIEGSADADNSDVGKVA